MRSSLVWRVYSVMGTRQYLPSVLPPSRGRLPDGVAAHPVDDLAGLLGGGHVGHDDAGGVGLEGADVVAVAALGDAHERIHIVETGGADLVLQVAPVVGHVFAANPDAIAAAQAGDFDDARVVEVDLEGRGELALADQGQDPAGAEFHEESSAMISATGTRREPWLRLRRPAMRTAMYSTVSANG
jgi:hypothetical protein